MCSPDWANKQKQSPPVNATGCACPSTVSEALPRATVPKHAYSPRSNRSPHGAVSSIRPATLKAWDAYVQAQNARAAEYSNRTPFLWSDGSPERLRHLHDGETVVAPFGENPHRVPLGLIHHWIGAVFLPGTCIDDVLSVVRDYDKYKDFYAPNIIESRVLR